MKDIAYMYMAEFGCNSEATIYTYILIGGLQIKFGYKFRQGKEGPPTVILAQWG